MSDFTGALTPPNGRFALVAARFNSFVVGPLLAGAKDGLRRHGVAEDAIDTVMVPGALEIPLVADRLAASGGYAAVVCLGAVVRGDTSHYDVVVNQSAAGLAQVALKHSLPVVNAILTTETVDQAVDRAGAKHGNKGFDAAAVAVEMANLLAALPGNPR